MENMIIIILSAVASYFGIYGGILQSIISPEEMKDGKKYFKVLSYILIILIILIQLLAKDLASSTAALLIVLALYYNQKGIEYISFGFILGLNNIFFLYSASIILIYGIVFGSLIYKKTDKRNILEKTGIYFILGLALGLSLSFFIN
jgi:hypothetical protein